MKRIVLFFVFAFIGMATVWAQALPFKDTGSKEGRIRQVEVTGNNLLPVNLICGTHAYFTIQLEPLIMINGASVKLGGYLYIKGIPVPLPVNDESLGGGASMLYEGRPVTYVIRLNIDKDFPEGDFVLELFLRNEVSRERIISFSIPVHIKKEKS